MTGDRQSSETTADAVVRGGGESLVHLGPKALTALETAFSSVVDAKQIVGHPSCFTPEVAAWADAKGLEIKESTFAPFGRLYITGAVQVDDSWLWRGE